MEYDHLRHWRAVISKIKVTVITSSPQFDEFAHNSTKKSHESTKIGTTVVQATVADTLHQFQGQKVKGQNVKGHQAA